MADNILHYKLSRSLRARGLKYIVIEWLERDIKVALFTGAWIEIPIYYSVFRYYFVALFTGAWIEIPASQNGIVRFCVALFTGAWIEIFLSLNTSKVISPSRSLRARGLK